MEVCSLYGNADRKLQRQQYGKQQMDLFCIHCSSAPSLACLLSCLPLGCLWFLELQPIPDVSQF